MNEDFNMLKSIFVAVTAIMLQLGIAVAIVMAFGWIWLLVYCFIGFFLNLSSVLWGKGWKIFP